MDELYKAAKDGKTAQVKLLLNKGFSTQSAVEYNQTPLHAAAMQGHEEIIKLLLEHRDDCKVQDFSGRTPLHWAVIGGHLAAVKILIHFMINRNVLDENDISSAMRIACQNHNAQMVSLLFDNMPESFNYNCNQELFLAIQHGNTEMAETILEKQNITIPPSRYYGFILNAIAKNRIEMAEVLLSKIKPDYLQKPGLVFKKFYILIMYASSIKMLEIILKKLDLDTSDIISSTNYQDQKAEVMNAFINKLIENGLEANVCNKHYKVTPLHIAAQFNNMQAIDKLIAKSTNLNLLDRLNQSALHIAIQENNLEITAKLLKAGANPLISSAIEENNLEVTAKLTKTGGETLISNLINGKITPLKTAFDKKDIKSIALIFDHLNQEQILAISNKNDFKNKVLQKALKLSKYADKIQELNAGLSSTSPSLLVTKSKSSGTADNISNQNKRQLAENSESQSSAKKHCGLELLYATAMMEEETTADGEPGNDQGTLGIIGELVENQNM